MRRAISSLQAYYCTTCGNAITSSKHVQTDRPTDMCNPTDAIASKNVGG